MITWYIIWALICPLCDTYVEETYNNSYSVMIENEDGRCLGECPNCHIALWLEKVYVKKIEEKADGFNEKDHTIKFKKIETVILDKREEIWKWL